ncbi:ectonucleoside triphosphate diphosphohydrolase 2-like [Thalassophryne amazonica]|uniref:ectonucleoside triphosphate diphosphohydrolase 2-like n=1 Tax=Thalassophryne amazonica TaxID=390379 RepID=UPI001470B458|nr:ectonucleoside triphosphate diphosphohydrolase 2-like [Thalassophryne amazonica]
MGLHACQFIFAAVLLLLAIIGILLSVLPVNKVVHPPENMYGIVLDAGSSHTSMYIYKWPANKHNDTGIVTQHDECHVKGGGISSYAGDHGGAAKSLEVCLENAKKAIPKSRHHLTPLYLGATAGMRLLNIMNATETQRILKEVSAKLQSYPFRFREAAILSGKDEGVYGWVTVNYLRENFIKYGFIGQWIDPGRATVGAMDLGGASTQITFETKENVEDETNLNELKLYGQTYRLYTQSFLCYGQDQFLRKLLAQLIKTQGMTAQVCHPCYPAHFNTSIKLGKDVFDSPCAKNLRPPQFDPQQSITIVGAGDYQLCLNNISLLFSFDNCNFSKCSFNGVFQPNVTGNFMAFSAFFFSHKYIKLLTGMSPRSSAEMTMAIKRMCNMTVAEMSKKTQQPEKYMKNVCAVAMFVQVLLTNAYQFDKDSLPRISFEKKVGDTAVGWTLGYMLSLSSMLPAESITLMRTLPPGPWTCILLLFISLLFIALGYLLMIFRKTKN